MFLTKNDFIVARTCPTKLYYKKLRYPSLLDDDPYLEFLADGGYMVEAMAKQLFLGGREIGHWEEPMRAFEETRQAVDAGDGTCFEATVIHDNLLARVDILQREGTTLRVIEVKSSSFDSEKDGPNPNNARSPASTCAQESSSDAQSRRSGRCRQNSCDAPRPVSGR
jgi:hypothetical protein